MKTSAGSFGARAPLAALVAVALAGCGGGDGGGSGGGALGVQQLPPVAESIALDPTTDCTMQGIGAAQLQADAAVTILDVSSGNTGGTANKPYCLVKVRVDPQVNIWVSLPSSAWNGRFRAEGNGVYAGNSQLGAATDSVAQGFVGVKTDTGHTGSPLSGAFGMESPGHPDTQLQIDFAYRSEHLMAVVGKQLTKAFYGQAPVRSYWYGCSTGGRQGLRMAQDFPDDYDAILAGSPAINWDRFQAYQIWPQVAMRMESGGPVPAAKQRLATGNAVAACDAADGVADSVIGDPRQCTYDPTKDTTITKSTCTSADNTCLTPGEASAIQKIWGGARDAAGNLLWPGLERGADLGALAGTSPFPIPIDQARYWVYFDPAWDWKTLNYDNYGQFFADNVAMVGPMMASNKPDISAFRGRGGKLIMYHGWADNLIMPEGTVRYWDAVSSSISHLNDSGFGNAKITDFARLYMVPGMGHCGGGSNVTDFGQGASGAVAMDEKHDVFRALMAWSEKGAAPSSITASRIVAGAVVRTRPLCPYPQVATYKGTGSTDDAANFSCANP